MKSSRPIDLHHQGGEVLGEDRERMEKAILAVVPELKGTDLSDAAIVEWLEKKKKS